MKARSLLTLFGPALIVFACARGGEDGQGPKGSGEGGEGGAEEPFGSGKDEGTSSTESSAGADGGAFGGGNSAGNTTEKSTESESLGGSAGLGHSLASDQFCDEYGMAVCKWRDTCRGDVCEEWPAYSRAMEECRRAIASLDSDFVSYDAEQAAVCVSAMNEHETCAAGPPFNAPAVREHCPGVFLGTVSPGQECTSSDYSFFFFDECEESYCANKVGSEPETRCFGNCIAYREKGESCQGDQRCAPGLACAEGRCEALRKEGEACAGTSCEPGLSCLGQPATCRDLRDLGDSCVDRYDCISSATCVEGRCAVDAPAGTPCNNSNNCVDGLYCRFLSDGGSTCSAFAQADEQCALASQPDEQMQCEEGFACPATAPFVCVPALAEEDQACGPYGCQTGLWCDESLPAPGSCQPLGQAGDHCVNATNCQSGMQCAVDSKCYPKQQAQGQPCDLFLDDACASGLFCDRESRLCQPSAAEDETCNPHLPLVSCQAGSYCACLAESCPAMSDGHNLADVCAKQKANGESCLINAECQGGFCIGEGVCASAVPQAPVCQRD